MADVADASLDQAFRGAVAHLQQTPSVKPSNQDKLRLYGLYKQASKGDCTTAAPSRMSVVARAKWAAWSQDARGMSREEAQRAYVELVRDLDPTFQNGKSLEEEGAEKDGDDAEEQMPVVKPLSDDLPTPFWPTLLACLAVSGLGFLAFLASTLSPTALTALGVAVAGLLGAFGTVAALVDAHGLIALYPPLLQRVLLERTPVEVILDGTVVKRAREAFDEIAPVFYCKTEEDRLRALAGMSDKTRRTMSMRGIVNLLPAWQQRLLLSSRELARQRARRSQDATAFNPPPDAQPDGGRKLNDRRPNLDAQRELARNLFRRGLRDRAADWLVRSLDPQTCKALALALACVLSLQLRASPAARAAFRNALRNSLLRGASTGAIVFAALAVVHQAARRYGNQRLRQGRPL